MELHPVIMAAGRGSRMMDIARHCPRALLPIANIPAVCYPIAMLDRVGFDEAIVVVPEEHSHNIQKAVVEFTNTKIRLEYVTIAESQNLGTADTLRHIKDKIKADVLVISCDLITDVPLHRIVDIYRIHNATLTMLLSEISEQFTEVPPPGIKAKRTQEHDLIGLDENGMRLMFFSSEADLEETLTFRKSLLKKHPCIKMKSRLTDCHLYVMKKWLVQYLCENRSISSIKGELIPHLVKKQFSKPRLRDLSKATSSVLSVDTRPDIFMHAEEDKLETMARDMSSWNDHHGDMSDCYHNDKIRCYAYVLEDKSFFCARVNNMRAFCEVNRQIPKHLGALFPGRDFSSIHSSVKMKEKSQIGNDSVLDGGVIVGDKASIKRSIIGKHCVIGDRVKISNSVIMNHVKIDEGSTVSGSVIASDAQIGEKSEIKDSIIGAAKITMPLSKLTNEVYTDTERMMEI